MKFFCTTFALFLGLYFFRNNIAFSIIISLIFVAFIFIRFKLRFTIIILIVLVGGASLSGLNIEYNNESDTYSGMVVEVKENYFIFQSHFERFYVYDERSDKEVGDFLTIESQPSQLKFTNYESRFDFGSYLADKGVKRSLNLHNYKRDFSNPLRIHSRKQLFIEQFDDDTKALVNATIFGEKDYSSSLVATFDSLNLLFLLTVSGIHLHFIFSGLTYVFGLYTSRKVAEIVPVILFLPLSILSFPRISILRVFSIRIIKFVNDHFLKKRFSYLSLLSLLALFFLIIDFHLAYQEAFYIGFSISLLGVFYRTSLNLFTQKKRKLFLSFFAYLFVLPIACSNKNCLHLFSFPFQVLLIPILSIFIVLAYLSIMNVPITNVITSFAKFLVGISKSLNRIDIALPISVNEWFYFVYYASIIVIIYLLESQRIRHVRNVMIALTSFLLLNLVPIHIYRNSVAFINVGQGDSILIQNRNKYVLIDTGGNVGFDMAEECLIPYFNKIGVRHIDLLITTHDDYDHSGAAPSLMENFKVYNYYKNREDFPCRVGDLYFENINYYNGDENDSCLVFLVDFMNKKWLFTGDASVESEKSILNSGVNIDCDILKVGHHGSSTSSCDEFIRAASPSEAIISCGAKNKYGHPNKEVIERLEKYNVKIRRTDLEGTISYVSIFA